MSLEIMVSMAVSLLLAVYASHVALHYYSQSHSAIAYLKNASCSASSYVAYSFASCQYCNYQKQSVC